MIEGAGGVELAVYDFGPPGSAAPPLLLAHATGFHARCWLPVVEALGDRFHCFAFDERGHGDSPSPPTGDFDWHRFADDALCVVDHFGLERPFAAGHSCGGALLLLAEIHRPGTFRGLYCYEPVVFPVEPAPSPEDTPPGGNPMAAAARKRREVFDSYDAALANFASKPPMDGFAPEALDAYVRFGFEPAEGGVRIKCRGEDEARTFESSRFHGAYSRLGEVGCPVTLGCGEVSDGFPESVMRLHEARLPDARVDVVPELSHFGPLEDPAAVARHIAAAFGA